MRCREIANKIPLTRTKLIEVRSGIWVSVSFLKKIPRLMGRLGSRPHVVVVGRLGSGLRVSASFQIIPRPVGRLW